jgi:hypothetical protein
MTPALIEAIFAAAAIGDHLDLGAGSYLVPLGAGSYLVLVPLGEHRPEPLTTADRSARSSPPRAAPPREIDLQ